MTSLMKLAANLEKLRTSMSARGQDAVQQDEEYVVNTGIAFISALFTPAANGIMKTDIQHMITRANNISQVSGQHSSLSLHHILTKFELHAVTVPGGTVGWEGGKEWSWARHIRGSTGLGILQGPPPVTSTFNQTLQKLVSPLENTSGNYGALVSNPAYSDYGSITYLADMELKSSASWMDETPIIRFLHIVDCSTDIRSIKCDPIWGQVAIDGIVKDVERVISKRPTTTENTDKIEVIVIPIDVWVGLRTGVYKVVDWNVHDWSFNTAIIPVETSMLDTSAVWLYISSFLTSKIWNMRYVWRSKVYPNPNMTTTEVSKEFVFEVRPRASMNVIDGPGRAILVVTNITSRTGGEFMTVDDISIKMWNPHSAVRPESADVSANIYKYLDLGAETNYVHQYTMQVWRWLTTHIATNEAVNAAMALTAEACRCIAAGGIAHTINTTDPHFYSIGVSDKLPTLTNVQWVYDSWSDISSTEEDEKIRLHDVVTESQSQWISPFGFRPTLYGEMVGWDNRDWLKEYHDSDLTMTCHEATPDMRIARFVGLIAPADAPQYTYTQAISEAISGAGYLLSAVTAWMQMTSGISWLHWVINGRIENSSTQVELMNVMIREATGDRVRVDRPSDWWIENISISIGNTGGGTLSMIPYFSSTLVPWYYVKYILQKINFLMVSKIDERQRPVRKHKDSKELTMKTGLFFSTSETWQQLARMSSIIGMRESNDYVTYALTTSTDTALTNGYYSISLHRMLGIAADSTYDLSRTDINIKNVCDSACVIFPAMFYNLYRIPQELLLTGTKAKDGTGVAEQLVTGDIPDPWWDWLLAGVRAAIPALSLGLPMAGLVGAIKGLDAFLLERTHPHTAVKKQAEQRVAATKILDTAMTGVKDVLGVGTQAVAETRKAINEFVNPAPGSEE